MSLKLALYILLYIPLKVFSPRVFNRTLFWTWSPLMELLSLVPFASRAKEELQERSVGIRTLTSDVSASRRRARLHPRSPPSPRPIPAQVTLDPFRLQPPHQEQACTNNCGINYAPLFCASPFSAADRALIYSLQRAQADK